MSRETAWDRWLEGIGAERRGGELLAPCPLADSPDSAHREGGDPYKVVISPGTQKPVVIYCRCCGSERLYEILSAWGVRSGELQQLAIDGGFGTESESQPQPEYDFDLLHRAYTELLRLCPLTAADRQWLRRRGVSDELADYCGYGSIPSLSDGSRVGEVQAKVRSRIGLCDDVPGLRHARDLRGPGIAIPCRSPDGRIRAIKVRLTDGGRTRMRYLSSRYSGGLPALSDLHFPLGGFGESLWITEGERKADVLHHSGTGRTVAIPGVGCVAKAIHYAAQSRFEAVTLAFDRDAAGEKATETAISLLRRSRWRGELRRAVWGEGLKGIDDAIAAGSEIRFETVELGDRSATAAPPHTHRPRSLSEAIATSVWIERDFRSRYPQFNRDLSRAISSGGIRFGRVRDVGGVIGSPSLSDQEWSQWIASLSSATVASSGSGGQGSD